MESSGDSAFSARENAAVVISLAVANELTESDQIVRVNRGYAEKKAKEHVGYNAAFRYHCTYQREYSENPIRILHPAYR